MRPPFWALLLGGWATDTTYKGYQTAETGYRTQGTADTTEDTSYQTGGQEDYGWTNSTGHNFTTRGTTGRAGNLSSDAMAVYNGRTGNNQPDPLTGVPYNDGMVDTHDATFGANSYGGHGDAPDTTATSGDRDAGTACGAEGFLCDFKDYATMGAYDAFDFRWKIVDPLDYGKHKYQQRTLNCEVKITKGTNHLDGALDHEAAQAVHSSGHDYFYVPIGQENEGTNGGTDDPYCDVEGIRRQINDASLNMTDMIRIRGETARLNDGKNATKDIVGEQFDLVCTCTTSLATEAKTDFTNAANALITVLDANGKERELVVELSLYSDSSLLNEVVYPSTFPDASQHFYFLAKHESKEDWDVQLQISACVVCDIAATTCSTKTATVDAVPIWEQCRQILGGPQETQINPISWYRDATVYNAFKYGSSGSHRWSEKTPTTCPYHAIGLQKFRISNLENVMKMTCAVTACTARPCMPCSYPLSGQENVVTRRRRLGGPTRQLQRPGAEVEVTQNVRLLPTDQPRKPTAETAPEVEEKDRKVSVFALCLLLLMAILSAALVTWTLKRRREERGLKSVEPSEPGHTEPLEQKA